MGRYTCQNGHAFTSESRPASCPFCNVSMRQDYYVAKRPKTYSFNRILMLSIFIPLGAIIACSIVLWIIIHYSSKSNTPQRSVGLQNGTVIVPESWNKFENTEILAFPETLCDEAKVEVTKCKVPASIGNKVVLAGEPKNIKLEKDESINTPLYLKLNINANPVREVMVLHWDKATGYQPCTIWGTSSEQSEVIFDSRRFSVFVPILLSTSNFDRERIVKNKGVKFDPSKHGWTIGSSKGYYSIGGNSFGMAMISAWSFSNSNTSLSELVQKHGDFPDYEAILAVKAQMSQQEYYDRIIRQLYYTSDTPSTPGVITTLTTYDEGFNNQCNVLHAKAAISIYNQPFIVVMGNEAGKIASAVVYGYDNDDLLIYDPNYPGQVRTITYVANHLRSYRDTKGTANESDDDIYDKFFFVYEPSFGPNEKIKDLFQITDGVSSGSIDLRSPTINQIYKHREGRLEGTLTGEYAKNSDMSFYVNGIRQSVTVRNGEFAASFPVSYGVNRIVLVASTIGAGDTKSNWHKDTCTITRVVHGEMPPTKLLVTLNWEQDNSDVDLYVTQPDGESIWYSSMRTSSGGFLDFDNTKGKGPEHITFHNQSNILSGIYTVRVHYYSGMVNVNGIVTIVINEGTDRYLYVQVPWGPIYNSNGRNAKPMSQGSDWVNIAAVDVERSIIRVTRTGEMLYGGPQSKTAVVITVDGIQCLNTLLPGHQFDSMINGLHGLHYLKTNMNALIATPGVCINTSDIFSYEWYGDTDDTDRHVRNLSELIKQKYKYACESGQKFIVIAHSWGTVLSYMAFEKLRSESVPIVCDLYITGGSPLGCLNVRDRDGFQSLESGSLVVGLHLNKAYSVSRWPSASSSYDWARRWVNVWSVMDFISGPIYGKDASGRDVHNIRCDRPLRSAIEEVKDRMPSYIPFARKLVELSSELYAVADISFKAHSANAFGRIDDELLRELYVKKPRDIVLEEVINVIYK